MKNILKFSWLMFVLLLVLPVIILDSILNWDFGHLNILYDVPKQFNNMVIKNLSL